MQTPGRLLSLCAPRREQLQEVQAALHAASSKCSALAQENDLLRERSSPATAAASEDDALTEQVGSSALRCPCQYIRGRPASKAMFRMPQPQCPSTLELL